MSESGNAAELPVSSMAKFEMAQVPRSQINPAPYNPREIDPYAYDRLAEGLARFGLVEPLIWNRRTGHLVGGHQRLSLLDERERGDYTVPVAVVDLDEKVERELNVALNNPGMQGRFDLGRLESLFRDSETSPFEAGFDSLDLQMLFPADVAAEFVRRYGDEEQATLVGQGLPGSAAADDAAALTDEVLAIKEARKAHKTGQGEDLRFDHMVVIVFDSAAQTVTFLRALRLAETDQFLPVAKFCRAIQRPDLMRGAADAEPSTEPLTGG